MRSKTNNSKKGEREMRALSGWQRVAVAVFLFACVRVVSSGDPVLVESDENMDGRTDRWSWKVDDRLTTALVDQNRDGKPDRCYLYATVAGKQRIVEAWIDLDHDGEMDALSINASGLGSEGVRETWRRLEGEPPTFRYGKSDPEFKVLTIATVSSPRVRPTDQITTFSLRDTASSSPVYVQLPFGEAVLTHDGRPLRIDSQLPGRILITDEHFFATGVPERTTLHDLSCSQTVILTRNSQGRPVQVEWNEPSTQKTIQASDRNGDGQFDFFTLRYSGVDRCIEIDLDYDGLLDEVRDWRDSSYRVLEGDQIHDRSLPEIPEVALALL